MPEGQPRLRPIDGVLIFAVSWLVSFGVTLLVAGFVSIKAGALISTLVLAGVSLGLLAGAYGNPFACLGIWRVHPIVLLLTIVASLAIVPVSMAIEAGVVRKFGIPEEMLRTLLELLRADNLVQLFYVWLIAALGAALSEEVVFRGILQRSLAFRLNNWQALLITSVVFSVLHTIWRMAPIFVVSLYLGLIYIWTDSLVAPMVGHLTINTFTVLAIWSGDHAGQYVPAWFTDAEPPPFTLIMISIVVFGITLWSIRRLTIGRMGKPPIVNHDI